MARSSSESISSCRAAARDVCVLLGPVEKYGGLQTITSAVFASDTPTKFNPDTASAGQYLYNVRISAW